MQNEQTKQEKIKELCDKGYAYLQSGNEKEALCVFREMAEMGFSAAQFNLGTMYYNGQGTAPDYREALKWYRMAADKGLKEAQFAIGDMYEQGTGVERDLRQAAEWYTKAADQGHVRAFKTLVKLNSKIEQKEQGYPYYVDTPSDIKLGCLYHDCGQPIFITQKGGVGMLPSIGSCLLSGEILCNVTFESVDTKTTPQRGWFPRKRGGESRKGKGRATGNITPVPSPEMAAPVSGCALGGASRFVLVHLIMNAMGSHQCQLCGL